MSILSVVEFSRLGIQEFLKYVVDLLVAYRQALMMHRRL